MPHTQRVISVPVKPCVKRFLQTRTEQDRPRVVMNSFLGRLLFSTGSNVRRVKRTLKDMEGKEILLLDIASNDLRYRNWDRDRLVRIGLVLEEYFKDCFITWVEGQLLSPNKDYETAAIRDFADRFDISEDVYPMENFRKIWRDHKKRVLRREMMQETA